MSNQLLFIDQEALIKFKCSNCEELLQDPVQPSCGHRLCWLCAKEIFQNNTQPQCPLRDCSEEFTFVNDTIYYFPDRFVEREIQALEVECRRCNWRGRYGERCLHFQDCKDYCKFCGRKMSYFDVDRHTASCKVFLSNLEQELIHPLQETGAESRRKNPQLSSLVMGRFFSAFRHRSDFRHSVIVTLPTRVPQLLESMNINVASRRHDFRLLLLENSNHDGTMIWKTPQFSQQRADAVNGKYASIFSFPFHSGRYGYKMCLQLYIMGYGIGKGTHLSLFFVVMRGEFDNILQWPFTHKVTFKLLNQAGGRDIVDTFQPDPMSSSFRKPKSDMNIASGYPQFVSHTELERGGFIVDDTIFIKCIVETSSILHP